ncbi:MAG: hypothetical protein IH595_01910 [Bacteroidales bacterium]|nr:hypothetical protein [Bacteroidales bacterium]
MKKFFLFLFAILFLSGVLLAQTSNGTGGGYWNDPLTWSSGLVPTSSDDVIIASGDVVIVRSTQSCKTIAIEDGATLKLTSVVSLSTSSTVTVNGTLTMDAGIFNVGSSKTKYFKISGGTLNFSGGIINVEGRYAQLSGGNAYFSGDAELDISTSGEQKTASINIFSVTTNGVFSVATGSSVKIILKNGNSDVAPEIYYSPATSEFLGGSLIIENNSSVSDIYMDSDAPIYNLIVDVGAGNTFHFSEGCNFHMQNFTIQSGKAQADAGAQIEIDGNASLGSDGNLALEVDSASSAGIIFSQPPVEKLKADIFLNKGEFHYISSPVSLSQNFSDLNLDLTGGSGHDSFYYWDEALEYNGYIGNWVDILNGADGSGSESLMGSQKFETAKGYAIRYENSDHTLSLEGKILSSDQTIAVTRTSGSTGEGWNLMGNPFTASMAVNTGSGSNYFIKVNSDMLDPVYSGIYLWDEQPGYHGNRDDNLPISNASPARYISPGQAFSVKVKASGNLTFPADLQNIGHKVKFYKDVSDDNWTRCWFGLARNGNLQKETMIAFGNGMTDGLDVTYDIGSRKSNNQVDLFTRLVKDAGYDFAIQALPPLSDPQTVKVGMEVDSTGDYTFSLVNSENLSDVATIFLEDKETGTRVDLRKDKGYQFSADNPGRISDRFLLYFNQKITGTSSVAAPNSSTVSIKVVRHQLVVKNLMHKPVRCSLQLTNVLGQKVLYQKLNLAEGETFSNSIPDMKGLVVISVSNNDFLQTKKVIF